jgi:hypothetical protein
MSNHQLMFLCAEDEYLERMPEMYKFHDMKDRISKIAGFFGMVVSITLAFYLIFPTGQAQSKIAMFLVSLGIALALSGLTFKALLKSQR